jgi:hypothetical protein
MVNSGAARTDAEFVNISKNADNKSKTHEN